MSRREIYYLGTIVLIIIFMMIIQAGNQPLNWTKSFSRYDKNPFGSYVLNELIRDLFPAYSVENSNATIYEITSEEGFSGNLLSISQRFRPDKESLNAMLEIVSDGAMAFISSNEFPNVLLDTLEVKAGYDQTHLREFTTDKDSTFITLSGDQKYYFNHREFAEYFDSYPEDSKILGENEYNGTIALQVPFGEGAFVLNTTPIVFTNYFMLFGENHEAASSLLSSMPVDNLYWTEFYQVGKLQSSTPFRVILSYPSLKLALYLFLGLLVMYMLFEIKRKQRIIPIIRKLPNHTLQFIKTVGMLYFHSGDHKAMMMNRVHYFKEYLNLKMNIRWRDTEESIRQLIAKSGMPEAFIRTMIENMNEIEASTRLNHAQVLKFNKSLNQFYKGGHS